MAFDIFLKSPIDNNESQVVEIVSIKLRTVTAEGLAVSGKSKSFAILSKNI